MVKEFSKLMLRAYNNEADNAVRSMKPYTLDSSVARLTKARETIVKLGGTMNIRVTDSYHKLRVEELELTADYLAKMAEQKERDREERARLKEEEIARREFEREQDRLRKERAHYESTLATVRAQGDEAAATELESKLNEIGDALGRLLPEVRVVAGHPRLDLQGLRSRALQILQACEAEMGTSWSAMAWARASMVQRADPSGGSSVTSFTSNNTSSWS
jgi:chromosome segregation ATPase